jgi:hypothetical protein
MAGKIYLILGWLGLFWGVLPFGEDPVRKEKAFDAYLRDSMQIQVDLAYDAASKPDFYMSHVKTPVCKDTLCYLVEIDLYWDLLGNFKKYEVPPGKPLTKFDHEEFEAADHKKLASILSDKTSLLRDYDMKALVDENVRRTSGVVDATTGATSATIKDAVVGGALYTTHTLWHIVNGEVAGKILKHTEARFTDSLLVRMLRSEEYHYQYYALNKIPAEQIGNYLPELMQLVKSGDAYVPFFAIEKLPEATWKTASTQKQLVGMLGEVRFEMQNEIINRFKGIPLSPKAIKGLQEVLPQLTDQQKTKVLKLIKGHS